MERNNLLQHPAPEYQSFVDNQVLTDDQLNNMLDHLNYQDQLSRVLLSGVGIVCGLEISHDGDKHTITLTKGAAVTTAGNLMKFEGETFTAFKKFDDSYAKYASFTDDDDSTIPLWELETDSTPSDVGLLEDFSAFDLEEAIGLLYFEDYLEDDEDCSPVDCNTQGRQVVNNIRVLLVQKEDMDQVLRDDSILTSFSEKKPALETYLQPCYAKKVALSVVRLATYNEFLTAYDTSFKEIIERLQRLSTLALFKEIAEKSGVKPEESLEKIKEDIVANQYIYDLYKDLSDGYNELREMLLHQYAICCPNPNAFPKHVLVGPLTDDSSSWRHAFYQSPTHGHTNSLGKMKRVFKRLLYLIKNFGVPSEGKIIVTPSRGDEALLGKRAVPYYYNLQNMEKAEDFIHHWKQNDGDWVPNYYGTGYPKIENFSPLDICLEDHNFYRIEGHLKQDIREAHKRINKLIREKGLAFDVLPVAIGKYPNEEVIDYKKYRAHFEDLQMTLTEWNQELACVWKAAAEFFSKFSTENKGQHVDYTPQFRGSGVSAWGGIYGSRYPYGGYSEEAGNEAHDIDDAGVEAIRDRSKESSMLYSEKYMRTMQHRTHNVVLSNLYKQEGFIGEAFSEPSVYQGSALEIIANAMNYFSNSWAEWDSVHSNIEGLFPIHIIGHLVEMDNNNVHGIEDVTAANVDRYSNSVNALCDKLGVIKKYLDTEIRSGNSELNTELWVGEYYVVLNRLRTACCITEKIQTLQQEIDERKRRLFGEFILPRFLENNPGAEHKAGVTKGGTFVLLYLSKSPEMDKLNGGLMETIESSARLGYAQKEIPSLGDGTVVGDLCLPYICCSGMPSTTFVFPEQLATLRLPVDHICMGKEDAATVPLTIRPSDGDVMAFIQKRKIEENVISGNQSGTYFNPNEVAPEDYGKIIRFEVNGQPVEPILSVLQKPNAKFSYSFDPKNDLREGNTLAVVTFTNESTPFNDLTFEWDFDGEPVTNSKIKEFTHEFEVVPGENDDIPVKLIATNSKCEDDFSDHVNIDVPPLEEDDPIEDNPDDPPVDECEQVATDAIKASVNFTENYVSAHKDILSDEITSGFNGVLKPMYKDIFANMEEALQGSMDDEVFGFIAKGQSTIEGNLKNQDYEDPEKERVENHYSIMLYYELMLLYFFIQTCRNGDLVIDASIKKVKDSWEPFTDYVIENFAQVFKAFLAERDIHYYLTEIKDKLQKESRFNGEIAGIMDKIIAKLNRFLGRR